MNATRQLLEPLRCSEIFQNCKRDHIETTGMPITRRRVETSNLPLYDKRRGNRFCATRVEKSSACIPCVRTQEKPARSVSDSPCTITCASDLCETAVPVKLPPQTIEFPFDGLLRYSRLGRLALSLQPLDMNAVVAGVVQVMHFQMDQAGASIKLEPLPSCLGDPTQVGQVFMSLIDNAIKYRDPSRPLRLAIRGRVEHKRVIYVVVDNGLGIDQQHLSSVFEMFYRIYPNTTPGEGLGLTIAKRSLDRQQGKIWVESQIGAGCAFFVALPASPVGMLNRSVQTAPVLSAIH